MERTTFWRLEGRRTADAPSSSSYSKHSPHFSNAGESFESSFKCRLPLEPKLYPPPKRRKVAPTSTQRCSSPSEKVLWTRKYAPSRRIEIAGNQNIILQLFRWLEAWENSKSTSGFKRAALMTGSPGVGKSSAAVAVCRELQFLVVSVDGHSLRNKSLSSIRFANQSLTLQNSSLSSRKKAALIVEGMEEVDEATAQWFSESLKRSQLPIICICNDRNNKSIRKVLGCFMELKFQKPKPNQILKLLEEIQKKESFLVEKDFLKLLVANSQRDVRQTLLQSQYLLSTRTSLNGRLDAKDILLSSFASIDCLFSEKGTSSYQPLETRINLVLQDSDFVSLLVQENYINYKPARLRREALIMDSISKASDYLCFGDIISSKIHQLQRRELLHVQCAALALTCSSVLQGKMYSFDSANQSLRFPAWLSKRRQMKGELYKSYVGEHFHDHQPSKAKVFWSQVEIVGSEKVPINISDNELLSILKRHPTR